MGSVPGQRTKIPQASTWCGQKWKKSKKTKISLKGKFEVTFELSAIFKSLKIILLLKDIGLFKP